MEIRKKVVANRFGRLLTRMLWVALAPMSLLFIMVGAHGQQQVGDPASTQESMNNTWVQQADVSTPSPSTSHFQALPVGANPALGKTEDTDGLHFTDTRAAAWADEYYNDNDVQSFDSGLSHGSEKWVKSWKWFSTDGTAAPNTTFRWDVSGNLRGIIQGNVDNGWTIGNGVGYTDAKSQLAAISSSDTSPQIVKVEWNCSLQSGSMEWTVSSEGLEVKGSGAVENDHWSVGPDKDGPYHLLGNCMSNGQSTVTAEVDSDAWAESGGSNYADGAMHSVAFVDVESFTFTH